MILNLDMGGQFYFRENKDTYQAFSATAMMNTASTANTTYPTTSTTGSKP